MYRFILSSLASAFLVCSAQAEIMESSADGFHLHLEESSSLAPEILFDKIGKLPEWWSGEHSYSGKAENLSLSHMKSGGIWQESWKNGSVEHGHVIATSLSDEERMIRFDAALGPLQEVAAKGILTIRITPAEEDDVTEKSSVSFDYYVTGADFQSLDQWAPVVNEVLSEQIKSLAAE